MLKNLLVKYGLPILFALIIVGGLYGIVSAWVPFLTILFPVFMAPLLFGAFLGIILPIISSYYQEKQEKDSESKQSKKQK